MQSPHVLFALAIAPAVLAHEAAIDQLPLASTRTRVPSGNSARYASLNQASGHLIDHAGRKLDATICFEDCKNLTRDGICDDGGPGAMFSVCSPGFDCEDCGARQVASGNATNETTSLPPLPVNTTEAIITNQSTEAIVTDQSAWDTTASHVILISIAGFFGVLCLVCLFVVCTTRTIRFECRKTCEDVSAEDATNLGDKGTAATMDDVEGEVDGGFMEGGSGDAYGSDAVCSALVNDERLSPVRENDVRVVVATESVEVEPMALQDEPQAALAPAPAADKGGAANCLTKDGVAAAEELYPINTAGQRVDEDWVTIATAVGEEPSATDMALSPTDDAFLKALRAGLGLSEADSAFDTAVEMELRTLFQRCDTDSSQTMGRAEFTRALRILNLSHHLEMYGGDHGVVGGMEQLFRDLQTSTESNSITDEQFVALFRKLIEAEQARMPVPPPRRSAPKLDGKSSLEMYEDRQRHQYEEEMALALKRVASSAGVLDTKPPAIEPK